MELQAPHDQTIQQAMEKRKELRQVQEMQETLQVQEMQVLQVVKRGKVRV
jgi:hypothetical protein